MKLIDNNWQRLVTAARQANDGRDVTIPHGFATRVVAQAFANERPTGVLLERLALRALGVSCLLAVLGVVSNYTFLNQATATTTVDAYFTTDDPVAIVLDTTP